MLDDIRNITNMAQASVEVLFVFHWCQPFVRYWAVAPDDRGLCQTRWVFVQADMVTVQCVVLLNHSWGKGCANMLISILILLVPYFYLRRREMYFRKKLLLASLMGFGIFPVQYFHQAETLD